MNTENDSPGFSWRHVSVLWASELPVFVIGLNTVCANRTVPADLAIHSPKLPLGPVQIPRIDALISSVSVNVVLFVNVWLFPTVSVLAGKVLRTTVLNWTRLFCWLIVWTDVPLLRSMYHEPQSTTL